MFRYRMNGVPAHDAGAFLPRPAGGGRQTPASVSHGLVSVRSTMRAHVTATRPESPLCACTPGVGSTVNSSGAPGYIVPDRYVTRAYKNGQRTMGPRVKFSPLQPTVMPVPARQEVPLAELAARRALMGGRIESTPWPKAFQNYFRI